ncbi:hypothetical protein [uncultured Phycicoccus sp.]|uniref:hypothetical protein n=1 Tax=uncultured Phycicoccus sp. TaxID=661422 RepID=UPI002601D82B|nr:hypothetical protein [uncultured Phycicoccus sp.]
MAPARTTAALGAVLSLGLLVACSSGDPADAPTSGASAPTGTQATPGPSGTSSATTSAPESPGPGGTSGPGTVPPTTGTTSPGATASPGGGATPTPGTSPTATPVVIDVLGSFRDSGSTASKGGVGPASASTARKIGSRTGFFGDARASVDAGKAGETYAYARGATKASLTIPRSGTYAYDWRARYHVEGRAPGGPDDDANVRVSSWVDPGVFGERGPEVGADLTFGPGIELPIDGTLARTGQVTVKAGQRVDIRLESSCTVYSGGLSKASTCRSWIGFDRFVLRLVP